MTTQDYNFTLKHIGRYTDNYTLPDKIKQTMELLFQFLTDISPVVIEKSNIIHKILPILKIIKIGRLSFDFIIKLINIWK